VRDVLRWLKTGCPVVRPGRLRWAIALPPILWPGIEGAAARPETLRWATPAMERCEVDGAAARANEFRPVGAVMRWPARGSSLADAWRMGVWEAAAI
jgi:hypothetical protein